MRKRKFNYIVLLGTIILAMAACVEDEGNYTYVPTNEVNIGGITSAKEGGYSALYKVDRIKIEPQIEGTISGKDEKNMKYQWYVAQTEGLTTKRTIISNEKNLDFLAELKVGAYTLFFTVKDESTGLKWITETSLVISSSYTTGFILYGENEDRTIRLDLISMPPQRDTVVIANVFSNEKGLKGAENLIYSGAHNKRQTIWAVTNDGSYRLNSSPISFNLIENAIAEDLIFTSFNIKRPIKILDMIPHYVGSSAINGSSRGYITEDAIYFASIIGGEFFGNPINRYSSTDEKLFKPFPFFFHEGTSLSLKRGVFYDQDANKFVTHSATTGSSSTYCNALKDTEKDIFPWDQSVVKRTLVYGENLYGTVKMSCALMKGEDGSFHLYQFGTTGTAAKLFYYDLNAAPELAQATHYTFVSNQSIMLYSVGSKLWGYNYSSKKSVLLKDFGSEITYLSMEYHSNLSITQFMVATYDTANKGVVRKFDIVEDPNKIEMVARDRDVWHTDMKVKQIQWKNSAN